MSIHVYRSFRHHGEKQMLPVGMIFLLCQTSEPFHLQLWTHILLVISGCRHIINIKYYPWVLKHHSLDIKISFKNLEGAQEKIFSVPPVSSGTSWCRQWLNIVAYVKCSIVSIVCMQLVTTAARKAAVVTRKAADLLTSFTCLCKTQSCFFYFKV